MTKMTWFTFVLSLFLLPSCSEDFMRNIFDELDRKQFEAKEPIAEDCKLFKDYQTKEDNRLKNKFDAEKIKEFMKSYNKKLEKSF